MTEHVAATMNGDIIHAPARVDNTGCPLGIVSGTRYVTDNVSRRFRNTETWELDLWPTRREKSRPSNIKFMQGDSLMRDPTIRLIEDIVFAH